jgi:hypothetical protein
MYSIQADEKFEAFGENEESMIEVHSSSFQRLKAENHHQLDNSICIDSNQVSKNIRPRLNDPKIKLD